MAFPRHLRLAAWTLALFPACSDGTPRPLLAGRVVRHDGTAAVGAHVEIDGRQTTTGPDGAFSLDGLAAGAWLAEVVIGGERSHAAPIFVPEQGSQGVVISIPEAPAGGEADLWFAGDTMFARRFQDPNADGNTDDSRLAGADWDRRILGGVTPLIQDSDLSVVNFESTATDEGMIHPRKPYCLRSEPWTLDALTVAGVDVLALGNNHIYDYTDDGVAGTLAAADSVGLKRVGAGMSWQEAVEPLIVEANGLKIALISATTITGRAAGDDATEAEATPPYYTADPPEENGGVDKAGALQLNRANIEEAMRRAEAAGSDLQVLIAHGGTQYSSVESPAIGDLARAAIDMGVDLVVGHHPHVVQGVEVYRGVPIVYSVGNLVFDQQFVETFPGVVVEAHATRAGFDEVALRPIWLDDWNPFPVAGPDAVRILRRVAAQSAKLATAVRVDAAAGRAVILGARPASVERKQVVVEGARAAPLAIPDVYTGPWYVVGAGQPGVDFGRSLLASTTFERGAAAGDVGPSPSPALGWTVIGREKEVSGGVVRLRRTSASATNSTVRSVGRVRVTPGQRLTLTGRWMSTPDAGTAIARIAIYADRETGSDPVVVAEAKGRPGDWTSFDVSVIPPAGATWAQVQLIHDPPTRGAEGDVSFADVDLVAWSGDGNPPPADASWVTAQSGTVTLDLEAIP